MRHTNRADRRTHAVNAFPGHAARGRPEVLAGAEAEPLDRRWSAASRYGRRARVVATSPLTAGSLLLRFEVVDDGPFVFEPGNFVGVEAKVEGLGYRRSPYCIVSAPNADRHFDLLVRLVTDGPVSSWLAALQPGDEIAFRGPTGRSMVPRDLDRDLVLVGTGVGVGPLWSLATHLLEAGYEREIRLFWGLRTVEDLCLTDELDALAARYPNFSWHVTLSRPPAGWSGLRGRVTESVPPLLERLAGQHFVLCGNGSMIDELSAALSDVGVAQQHVHGEAYFGTRARPDPGAVAAIRERFAAADLFSAFAHQASTLFAVDHLLGSAGNADPAAPSDVFTGPDFLAHTR